MLQARRTFGCYWSKNRLSIEQLEEKRLLAILWVNEFDTGTNNPDFNIYGASEVYARELVNRAIDDWNSVILDQNYDNDNNPTTTPDFQLTLFATTLGTGVRGDALLTDITNPSDPMNWTRGVPQAARVRIDDDGGGAGWFFDATPLDDIEFTSIADTFSSSFVDIDAVAQARRDDFYRTVLHEIGHALGITSDPGAAIASMLTPLVHANNTPVRYLGLSGQTQLRRFESTNPGATYGVTATFVDGHIYEGSAVYLIEGVPGVQADPTTVYESGNITTPLSFDIHPNELLNPGVTVPAGNGNPQNETVRQWISDLDAMILADAYGYEVTLPSELNTAHAALDSITGKLLVQGSARNVTTGAGVNDTITLQRITDTDGDDILVNVNGNLERVPFAQVKDIIIHGNGGADTVTVYPNVTQSWQQVQYVVSSNQDALEISSSVGGSSTTNGIVDLSAVVPGSQTTLRAAIVEANAAGAARSIYVGRGTYNLSLNGSGGDTQGDLDITGNVTIVGAGAGATIINAGTLTSQDRVFEINGAHRILNLSRVTVTGGNIASHATETTGGAINVLNGAAFNLDQSAVVGNTGKWYGGAIYSAGSTTSTSITNSVVTGNQLSNNSAPSNYGGGGIYAITGSLTLTNSMVANNNADVGQDDVFGVATTWNSGGNNAFTTLHSNLISDFPTSGANPNFVGSATYVVTSLVDSFDANRNSDVVERSLREAIDLANLDDGVASGTAETIWLPAWNFVLTRDRQTYGSGTTDTNVAWGDLDITDWLSVRGIATGSTKVQWKSGVADAVFDLLGDFTGDGLVGSPDNGNVNGQDYLKWSSQYSSGVGNPQLNEFSADGDDDGDVDGDDLAIWQAYYGNYLTLTNLEAILA